MYSNPYIPNYGTSFNQQNMNDRIDNQIAQLQQMKEQIKNNPINQSNQTPSINQTFQLAPTSQGNMRYANTLEEVNKEIVYADTPYFSKDMSVLWVKSATGDVKAYELKEMVYQDEKDLQIEFLMGQIEELKGMIKNNEQFIANANESKVSTNAPATDDTIRESTPKSKSTSIQRISTSKTK